MESKTDNLKIIAFLMLLLFIGYMLNGCKPRKEIIETHSTDTIYRSEIIKIDNPQLTEIVIDNICDSLGNLLPIYYTNVSNNTQTSLKSSNNSLILSVNVDSIVNSKVNEYKSSLKTEKEVIIKEVKRPLNLWLLLYSIAATIWIFRKPLIKLIKLI